MRKRRSISRLLIRLSYSVIKLVFNKFNSSICLIKMIMRFAMMFKKIIPGIAFSMLMFNASAQAQVPGIGLPGLGELSGVLALPVDSLGELNSIPGLEGLPIPGFPYGDAINGASNGFGQNEPGEKEVNLFLQPVNEIANNTEPTIEALLSANPEGRFYIPLIEYAMPILDAITIAPQKAILKSNGIDTFPDIVEPTYQLGIPYIFYGINTIYDNGGTEGAALVFTAVNDLTGARLIAKPHALFRALPFSFAELTDPNLLHDLNESVGVSVLGVSNSGAL